MNQDRLLTVGILIFDDVKVLDFCGLFLLPAYTTGLNATGFRL